MKHILIIIILFAGVSAFSQKINQKVVDTNNHKEIILGYADFEGLKTSDLFDSSFRKEYTDYQLDKSLVESLGKKIRKTKITIVMGTWCGDSKEQVPRFYKILEAAGYKIKNVTIICVDRKKRAGDIDISAMDIKLVPTFIFYRKGKEIGRIVETPVLSLEKDIMKILEQQ